VAELRGDKSHRSRTLMALDAMIESVREDMRENDPGNHATIGALNGELKGLMAARTYVELDSVRSHVGQSEAERIAEAGTSFPAWAESAPSTTLPRHFETLDAGLELAVRQAVIDWNREQIPTPPINIDAFGEGELAGAILARIKATASAPSAIAQLEAGKPCPTCAQTFCGGLTLADGYKLHIDRERLVLAVMDELDCMRRGIAVSRGDEVPDPLPMLRLWTASRDSIDAGERAMEEGMRRAAKEKENNRADGGKA
jgi:hypothetical protein